ncbi:MAG: hypothetical protein R3A50_00540 [Saprospiraceae bacterium]
MIHIRKQPETRPYLEQDVLVRWVQTQAADMEAYKLEELGIATHIGELVGRKAGLVSKGEYAHSRLSLQESGAVLASFPLLGKIPGKIQADQFTVWFELELPALIPSGIFGKEIRFKAGRHLMASVLGNWVVFFKPER